MSAQCHNASSNTHLCTITCPPFPLSAHPRQNLPVSLRDVTRIGQVEPCEMMEMGHEYEDVSKFPQKGVANLHNRSEDYDYVSNIQARGVANLQKVGEEYAVIPNTTEDIPAKSQLRTQCTDLQLSPASQSSHHPPASKTEAESSNDDFEFTECVAYKTTVRAPPPASNQ